MELELVQCSAFEYLLPKEQCPGMRVNGRIFAAPSFWEGEGGREALLQVAHMAMLPGVVGEVLAMPDMHWGYGFPIGGVAATDLEEGVISPGGVGYDINCGVRLLTTPLTEREVNLKLEPLIEKLYRAVPTGVGSEGRLSLKKRELDRVLSEGASWAVAQELGLLEDLERIEEGGSLPGADPAAVSVRAKERGRSQMGTLGSGNHFLELQVVDDLYDCEGAQKFSIARGQVVCMIHTGSRGLGYQVCSDFLKRAVQAQEKVQPALPDRQLLSVPFRSPEGEAYFRAMQAAANFAFANREIVGHFVREAFQELFGLAPKEIPLVYDVCHNIARVEEHHIGGVKRGVLVHRKGATRALPPGHSLLPPCTLTAGQPVLIPGDMGRASFLLVGGERGVEKSFCTTCHGAGRQLSRTQARKRVDGKELLRQLREQGIVVRAKSPRTVSEEAPCAYRDAAEVVQVCEEVGLSRRIARLRPLGCVKG